jgi:hypothetical protein
MAVLSLKSPKERRPGPYPADRHCSCGAKLSRYNPSTFCAPCSGGDWIAGDPSEGEVAELREKRLAEIGVAAA